MFKEIKNSKIRKKLKRTQNSQKKFEKEKNKRLAFIISTLSGVSTVVQQTKHLPVAPGPHVGASLGSTALLLIQPVDSQGGSGGWLKSLH